MEQFMGNAQITALAASGVILAASLLLTWTLAAMLRRLAGRHQAYSNPLGPVDPLAEMQHSHLEALSASIQLPTLPLMLFGGYAALILWKPLYHDPAAVAVLAVGGFGAMVIQFMRLLRTSRCFSLAGLAAGNLRFTEQALMPLYQQGYLLFHHVTVTGEVIDHLVVGAKGIFVIEVFTPRVLTGRDKAKGSTATYDGRAIVYDDQTDYETISQAQRKAERISEWLSGFLSEPVAARAIIAMPGWTIKRTSPEGISVVNPGQFGSLFAHVQARPLEALDIQIIADRLQEALRAGNALEGENPPQDRMVDDAGRAALAGD